MADPQLPRRLPFSLYAVGAIALCVLSIVLLRRWTAQDSPQPSEHRERRASRDEPMPAPSPNAPRPAPAVSASARAEVRAGHQRGDVLIAAKWGGGKGELGLSRPAEGNPEAPMSFAMDSQGRAWVLDQVNGRLVSYGPDGSVLGEQRLEQRVPQDVAISPQGTLAVLDRLGDKTVALIGPDGSPKGTLPLEGKGIADTGEVTGVFLDGDDVYAEVEHGTLVDIGKTDGTPSEDRSELPGRPSRDGRLLLNAGITQASEGRMWVSATRRKPIAPQFTREFHLAGEIMYLMLLDSDRVGTIYVAALHIPVPQAAPSVTLMCLEPERGEPLGTVELPANTSADETFREMTVLDGGGVVYAVRTEAGVSYQYYPCP